MVWSVSARVARFAFGLGSSVIVVRSLGEYDYGVLSLLRTMLTFIVVLAGAGFGQAILKFLPTLRVHRDPAGARRLARQVLAGQLTVWFIVLVVVALVRDQLAGLFPMPGLAPMIVAAAALSIFEVFFTLLTQILNASYDTRRLSLAVIASYIVYIGLLLIVLPRGWGVLGVLVSIAAGHFVASLIVMPRVVAAFEFDGAPAGGAAQAKTSEAARQTPADAVAVSAHRGTGIDRRRLMRFSLPFAAVGVLNLIVWRQSETLLLAHFRTAEETGFFDLAYRLPQTLLEFIPGTIWPIVLAGVSEVYARNSDDLRRALRAYYKALFFMAAPISFFGIALGGSLITILFGEAMAPAAVPTQVFFAVFTVSFFGAPLSMALYVMEKPHINLLIYIVLAVVNVGLDLLLIPRFGIAGAIAPVALVILISPFIYKQVVDRELGNVEIPYGFILRTFAASSPMLLWLYGARYINDVVGLTLAAIASAIVVVIMIRLLKVIGREEADMLGSIPLPAAERLVKFMRP
jgi:O-antigen/teichoic acid export membrane protein